MNQQQQQQQPPPLEDGGLLLRILYRDSSLVVVSKPSGMSSHGVPEPSAQTVLRSQLGKEVYAAHRIDVPTTGLLLFGFKKRVLRELQLVMSSKSKSIKTYLVLVHGSFDSGVVVVDAPIRAQHKLKDAKTEFMNIAEFQRSILVPEGIDALDSSEINEMRKRGIEYDSEKGLLNYRASLVVAYLITGRTHQIRKHCRHVGCPIVNDHVYGFRSLDAFLNKTLFKESVNMKRMFLHSFCWEGILIERRAWCRWVEGIGRSVGETWRGWERGNEKVLEVPWPANVELTTDHWDAMLRKLNCGDKLLATLSSNRIKVFARRNWMNVKGVEWDTVDVKEIETKIIDKWQEIDDKLQQEEFGEISWKSLQYDEYVDFEREIG